MELKVGIDNVIICQSNHFLDHCFQGKASWELACHGWKLSAYLYYWYANHIIFSFD
jgi:hypothetical protein